MNDITKVLIGGVCLGASFTLAAMVADVVTQSRKPHHPVFYDPADFLNSLRK